MNASRRDPLLAYIGIGSNLDDPCRQVLAAIRLLDELPGCHVVRQSSLYRSAPFGNVVQDDFVNAVVALETALPADKLLAGLQELERRQGRVPGALRWGPRIIDLDILLYSEEAVDLPGLTIPHPGIAARNFVLLPLREIAPGLVIPGLGPLAGIVVDETTPAIKRLDT